MRAEDLRSSHVFLCHEPSRGFQEARPPQRESRAREIGCSEDVVRYLDQFELRIWRQVVAKFFYEYLQRLVDCAAALQWTYLGIQRIEGRESQNVFGINRIWIAEPAFDLRDRETTRARRYWRAGA